MAFKAAGPVVVAGRELPPRAAHLVGAIAPALLAAFVVTGTFSSSGALTLDARALGLAAAAICVALRATLLAAVIVAAAITAFARALS